MSRKDTKMHVLNFRAALAAILLVGFALTATPVRADSLVESADKTTADICATMDEACQKAHALVLVTASIADMSVMLAKITLSAKDIADAKAALQEYGIAMLAFLKQYGEKK